MLRACVLDAPAADAAALALLKSARSLSVRQVLLCRLYGYEIDMWSLGACTHTRTHARTLGDGRVVPACVAPSWPLPDHAYLVHLVPGYLALAPGSVPWPMLSWESVHWLTWPCLGYLALPCPGYLLLPLCWLPAVSAVSMSMGPCVRDPCLTRAPCSARLKRRPSRSLRTTPCPRRTTLWPHYSMAALLPGRAPWPAHHAAPHAAPDAATRGAGGGGLQPARAS
jgi:hypothetical protein